jgi:Mce-associated membrane protein
MTAATRRKIAGDRSRPRRAPADGPVIDLDAPTTHAAPEQTEPVPTDQPDQSETAPHATSEPETKPQAASESEPQAETETEPTAVRRRRPALVTVALSMSLVAVLAACALAGLTTRRDSSDAAAGTAALGAATKSAALILSYDYNHLDSDFASAAALTTGSFRTDYLATTSKAVASLATQTHAVVVAKVAAGGVVSSTTSQATVLLFVDQTTTSNRLSAPQTDLNRVELTMRKVHGHWLVSALTAL